MTRWTTLGLLTVLAALSGCGSSLPGDGATQNNTLKIVFINQTDVEVDPNFYLSASNSTTTDLFGNTANMYKNFDGKTTIAAKATVTITLDYDKATTIGSNLASFGSILSWTGGKSDDVVVLHEGVDFDHPESITFTFSKDSQNHYHTTAAVTPATPSL